MQADIRDPGSIPGSGRSPEKENGKPFQYSCSGIPWTENPGRLLSIDHTESNANTELSFRMLNVKL